MLEGLFGNNNTETSGYAYDLMGIVESSIPGIQNSIENYLQGVDDIIAKISATDTNVSAAFKGQAQVERVSTYLVNAIETIKEVTTEMRKFKDALEQVKANYNTQSSEISVTEINKDGLNITTGVSGFGD